MRRLAVTLFLAFALVFLEAPAGAQIVIRGSSGGRSGEARPMQQIGSRKFADKPLARIWYSKISGAGSFEYMRRVSQEMGMRQSMLMMMPPGVARVAQGEVMRPNRELKGMLVFLTKGLIPTPETLNFQTVKDAATFRKLVLQRKNELGDSGELIGRDDRFEVKLNLRRLSGALPAPDKLDGDNDSARPRGAIAFSFRVGSSPEDGGDKDAKPDEPPIMEMASMSTYYRYHDGVMFESQAPELHTMRLPRLEALELKKDQQSLDLYADIDLTQIPQAFKDVFWNTIAAKANAFLQQYDEEPDEEYALRKRSGDFTMALTRAAILDVDRIQLSLKFANEKEPLRANLVVDARDNSNLAKQLGEVSGGVSRFDNLRQQKSPLTIASAWRMPENFRELLKALFNKGRLRLEEELVTDSDSLLAIEDIFEVLTETVDAGAADAIVKLGGNTHEGFALYGGLRIQGADQLARSLSALLGKLPTTPENDVRVTREGGREFLSFRLDELQLPGLAENEQLPAQLHFTVAESCLWFSLGESTSFDTLVACLAEFEEDRSQAPRATAPFVLHLNLSDWLKSDEREAANKFSEVPTQTLEQFERAVHRSFANQFSFSLVGPDNKIEPPNMEFRESYLAKAIKSGQDELRLEVATSPRRVQVKARIGEGLIKFFVARVMDVQNRAMENMRIYIEDEDGNRSITVGPETKDGKEH